MVYYIEEIKEKLKFPSYYKTLEHIGMTRQNWTALKKGGGVSTENAIKIAKILEIDPLEVMAYSMALQSKTKETRHVWLKLAKNIEEGKKRTLPKPSIIESFPVTK